MKQELLNEINKKLSTVFDVYDVGNGEPTTITITVLKGRDPTKYETKIVLNNTGVDFSGIEA
jgi:hypothetical protein